MAIDYAKGFRKHSAALRDLCLKLSFAGIGVVWIFRLSTESEAPKLPIDLLRPCVAFVISLFFPFAFYVVLVIYCHIRHDSEAEDDTEEEPDTLDRWIVRCLDFLIYGQAACVMVAYCLLHMFIRSGFSSI